jgi:mRNA interferase RelE/StbE
VTDADPFDLVLTPPAVRAIERSLPEHVAAAVIEFLTAALVENTHRVGKALRGDLAGIYAARRGTYRVLYRINEELHEVVVLRVEHRATAYRKQ